MYQQFIFETPTDEQGIVFAHNVQFAPSYVVFRDPDGEIIVALNSDGVLQLRPERNAEGNVVRYSRGEAIRLSNTPVETE